MISFVWVVAASFGLAVIVMLFGYRRPSIDRMTSGGHRWVEFLFGASAFGNGRMTELALTILCALYGTILLTAPDAIYRSVDIADLAWAGPGRFIAIPFLLNAVLSGFGIILNVRGWGNSSPLRFAGALIGSMIWIWIAVNLAVLNEFGALGFSVSIVNIYLSTRIMAMALANLPPPGAPGRI